MVTGDKAQGNKASIVRVREQSAAIEEKAIDIVMPLLCNTRNTTWHQDIDIRLSVLGRTSKKDASF